MAEGSDGQAFDEPLPNLHSFLPLSPHLWPMSSSHGAYVPVQHSSTPNLLNSPASAGFTQYSDSKIPNSPMSARSGPAPFLPTDPGNHRVVREPRTAPTRAQVHGATPVTAAVHIRQVPSCARPRRLGRGYPAHTEADDALHDPRNDRNAHNVFTGRGIENVGCLVLLCLIIVGVLCVGFYFYLSGVRPANSNLTCAPSLGYPVTAHFMNRTPASQLRVNTSGQIPNIGNWGLIDLDTPKDATPSPRTMTRRRRCSLCSATNSKLRDGRFIPATTHTGKQSISTTGKPGISSGAAHLSALYVAAKSHIYIFRYDPAAVSTVNGALQINLTQADPATNHNLSYMGGLVTTWNKFCFTGGLIVTSLMLPGATNVFGLWPAVWTMCGDTCNDNCLALGSIDVAVNVASVGEFRQFITKHGAYGCKS
ncbi:beta-glucan synthesis-associated protein-domain-containing protein [Mycena galopus ATCC 62051]|nr:beta-glucan synthesis-associated protein-domain-containing protein [Mycena galopus ATCC 62051]